MAKYSKFNIVYLMQKWMDSVAGQTFMNYAYSWGAAVVILGTLFKLTHLPGANLMLFIGMGTEVFVFFISAFDRPFDKTSDGMDLATDSQLQRQVEIVTPNINENIENVNNTDEIDNIATTSSVSTGASAPSAPQQSIVFGGSPVVIGGGTVAPTQSVEGVQTSSPTVMPASDEATSAESSAASTASGPVVVGGGVIGGGAIGAPAPAVTKETAEAMEVATTTYVDRLNELNELLLKVGAQSERLTTDSEEMENLNRTLTGIARIYEMQLKSASQQINTQDEINEQTRKMAQQIAELNAIYARMIEAMTVNMPQAAAK